ncbi:helix-turn-helix transcriptional regulator [bacterium]|nr:helix-turn-helix transcriptional regulator [bacterium]
MTDCLDEDIALKKIGLELMFMTEDKYSSPDGITAVELAKVLEMDLTTVKKKLRILQENSLVRVIGINPKYWKFDEYNFQRMDTENEIYRLITCFDDVDFDRFFDY